MIGEFPEVSNFGQLFLNSTGSFTTNRQFFPDIALNYRMIAKRYPIRTEWLAVRFPAVKSSLYVTAN